MRFVDDKGNVYETALAVPSYEVNTEAKKINLTVRIYKSAIEFDQGKPPIPAFDGGEKKASFTSEAFDAFVLANAETMETNATVIWESFDAMLTVPDGQGGWKSFFDDAGEIILPEALRAKK